METKTYLYSESPKDFLKDKDWLFEKASNQKINNRLRKNYKNFNQEYLAISITYDKDPIAVSILQERDCFNNMARILTRFYYDSPYHKQKSLMPVTHNTSVKDINKGLRSFTIKMIQQQIAAGKRLGIEDFFVSKEGDKSYLMQDFYNRVIVSLPEYNWSFDKKNKYQVVEPHHYQWIVWHGKNTLKKQITSH